MSMQKQLLVMADQLLKSNGFAFDGTPFEEFKKNLSQKKFEKGIIKTAQGGRQRKWRRH